METLFEDDYINNKVLKRLIKEVKREQVSKAIKHMDYFLELRKKMNPKYKYMSLQNTKVSLKQFNNAGKNLQA